MSGIDLKKFPGFTQKEDDYCLLACIQNILYYYDSQTNIDQYKLDRHFRKYVNPSTDHPYFKFFAKYLSTIKPNYQGVYDEYENIEDYIEKIKSSLDNQIPIMLSLKSIQNHAHIVIAYEYEGDILKLFDPNNRLKNNYITIKFEQVHSILKGIGNFDAFSIISIKNQA